MTVSGHNSIVVGGRLAGVQKQWALQDTTTSSHTWTLVILLVQARGGKTQDGLAGGLH